MLRRCLCLHKQSKKTELFTAKTLKINKINIIKFTKRGLFCYIYIYFHGES
jgi:hypothetical protein